MKPLRSDTALYTLVDEKGPIRMSGSYVDYLLRAVMKKFREHAKKTGNQIEIRTDDSIPCEFTGFHLDRDQHETILLSQRP